MAWAQIFSSRAAYFVMGAAAAGTVCASPGVKEALRTALRKSIKGGLLVKREVQTIYEQVREELEDLTAEAEAEIAADTEAAGKPAKDQPEA
ncbi:MAG: DUF5132 domain-containing protein [Gemmataceae bacterium]